MLHQLVHGAFYDVVCICETWLNESILSSELLPGYSVFRRDRIGKVGGGVFIAVKNGIQATRRLDLEPESSELVATELIASNKNRFLFTFYRPPNSTPDLSDVLQELNTSLQNTTA